MDVKVLRLTRYGLTAEQAKKRVEFNDIFLRLGRLIYFLKDK